MAAGFLLIILIIWAVSVLIIGISVGLKIVGLLIFGAISGAIASKIANEKNSFGKNVVLGLFGSLIGGIVFELIGVDGNEGILYQFGASVVGALLLIVLGRGFSKK